MKSTGIVRNLDKLGRIVLPKELRKSLSIAVQDPIEIFTDDDMIILKRYHKSCIFCNSTEELHVYQEKNVCKNCLEKLTDEFCSF